MVCGFLRGRTLLRREEVSELLESGLLLEGLTHMSGGTQLRDAFEAVRLWVNSE